MADDLLLEGAGRVLRDSLTGLSRRQQLIAGNIANMDTPGFRAKDNTFEVALQREMSGEGDARLPMFRTAAMHMNAGDGPETQFAAVDREGPLQDNGTGVDVDYEMARLSETTIRYNAVSQLTSARIALLRAAVTEGRR